MNEDSKRVQAPAGLGTLRAQTPIQTLYSSAWNISRHELIAGAAEKLLQTSLKAKARIESILAVVGATTLSDIAGWADEVKRHKPTADDDPDTIAFLKDDRNKRNASWHFVDLPLDCTEYSRGKYSEFTSDEDVVQIIHLATDCLSSGKTDRFSTLNALRLVVHLVGDVHQPLHVGCSYLREGGDHAELVRDPQAIKRESLESDRGGNRLILPINSKGINLHSYWDSTLGGHVMIDESSSYSFAKQQEVGRLTAIASPDSGAGEATGFSVALADSPPLTGIEQWATDSLFSARQAYEDLEVDIRQNSGYRIKWQGKPKYDARCSPILHGRLVEAAKNLAGLLSASL